MRILRTPLAAAAITFGFVLASCASHQEGVVPQTAPASSARTPQSLGLGNQQWVSCNNVPATGERDEKSSRKQNQESSRSGAQHKEQGHGHDGHSGERDHGADAGDDGASGGTGNCAGIRLIAPLATVVTTTPGNPGSTTRNVQFSFTLSTANCAPVHVGGGSPSPVPSATPSDGERGDDAAAIQTSSAFPLGAAPIALTSEVTSYLGRLTVTDPCPVAQPFGFPATALASSVQPGYYIVLLSQNATGNFGITGAMSLFSISGQALTFAPQPNALIDLPQGFTYAFYLAQTTAPDLIQLPNGINGGFH